jgi:hypothetical protein
MHGLLRWLILASYENASLTPQTNDVPRANARHPLERAAYINIGIATMFVAADMMDHFVQWFGGAPANAGHMGDPRVAIALVLGAVTIAAAIALRARERAAQAALRELDTIDAVIARGRATAERIARFRDE